MNLINVYYTAPFTRSLKRLKKKHPQVGKDALRLIERLQGGETPGDQIPGVSYPVYKVRVSSRDMQRGKRGGFRLIYYVSTPTAIYLIEIYSKSEQENYPPDKLRQIIKEILED